VKYEKLENLSSQLIKDWINNKRQSLDLVNKWKDLSLVKKIICITTGIVIAVKTGLFTLFAGLFIFSLPLLWLIAFFKPSIVWSSTRIQATKHILFSFILVVIAVGISRPFMPQDKYHTLKQTPTLWEYVVGNDAEFDAKGNLIKESNLSISDRILGNDAKLNDKGDVLDLLRL